MSKIEQENAVIEGRADSSLRDVPRSTVIEGFATDMSVNAGTRVDFKSGASGQMRQGQIARRCAGALLQE